MRYLKQWFKVFILVKNLEGFRVAINFMFIFRKERHYKELCELEKELKKIDIKS